MVAGLNTLQKTQAGLEATRGTGVPATRIVYLDRGAWFDHMVDRQLPDEDRNSFIDYYRQLTVAQHAGFQGGANATFDDLPWWCQLYAKGGVTGVLSAVTVYTYTFAPTATSDDLKTATLEVGNDTGAYQIPYALGEKLELTWSAGQPLKMSVDMLGQQVISQAFTGALSDRTGIEDIIGTTAQVWIDNAGGTIGTTVAGNVLGGKITLQNKWQQITHLKGQLYPDDAQRDSRSIQYELDIHFNNATEFAQLLTGGERIIRIGFLGGVIAGSTGSVHKSLNLDLYGYHVTAPFGVSNAIRTVKVTGSTVYDTTATTDWKMTIANQLVSLP